MLQKNPSSIDKSAAVSCLLAREKKSAEKLAFARHSLRAPLGHFSSATSWIVKGRGALGRRETAGSAALVNAWGMGLKAAGDRPPLGSLMLGLQKEGMVSEQGKTAGKVKLVSGLVDFVILQSLSVYFSSGQHFLLSLYAIYQKEMCNQCGKRRVLKEGVIVI